MSLRRRIAGLREAYRAIGRIEAGVSRLERRLDAVGGELDELRLASSASAARTLGAIGLLAADEPGNHERLAVARAQPGYERGWDEERPLVSVAIATSGRPELVERALPSVLSQTHDNLEVIVAGDDAGAETEAAVRALGDERVRFLDLGPRFEWTEDPRKRWLVGATRGQNAATAAASGHWIAPFDDDDALRPECIEVLLESARRERAELVYGRVRFHMADGATAEIGARPPRLGQFSWAAGMYRAQLRSFRRELIAAELDQPGDWWLAARMLRAGARFAMVDAVLCDAYPSGRGEGWVEDHRSDLA